MKTKERIFGSALRSRHGFPLKKEEEKKTKHVSSSQRISPDTEKGGKMSIFLVIFEDDNKDSNLKSLHAGVQKQRYCLLHARLADACKKNCMKNFLCEDVLLVRTQNIECAFLAFLCPKSRQDNL